jgi:hypothetical protein
MDILIYHRNKPIDVIAFCNLHLSSKSNIETHADSEYRNENVRITTRIDEVFTQYH